MDSKIYRHVFGSFVNNSGTHHYNVPCHNLISVDALREMSEVLNDRGTSSRDDGDNACEQSTSSSFPFFKALEYEAVKNTVVLPGSGVRDRAHELVKEKWKWREKLKSVRPKDTKKALKYLKSLNGRTQSESNEAIEKYLKHIKQDPEPDFIGDYNWLYTGGNIAGCMFNNEYCLVSADEVDENMCLNILQLDGSFKKLDGEDGGIRRCYIHDNSPILQITPCNEGDNLLCLLRQRKKMCLIEIDISSSSDIIWSYMDCYKNKLITSCDINSGCELVACINSNFQINTFDICTGHAVSSYQHVFESDMLWSQILFSDVDKVVYLADSSCLKLYDLRVDSKGIDLYKPVPNISKCEVICNFMKSKRRSEILYVASSHHVMEVDTRNGKTIQNWTHLMKFAPQFGVTVYGNGDELVILQSENRDEMVAILNQQSRGSGAFISESMPRVVDTVRREWTEARLNGICLYPGIGDRLNFPITGLHGVKDPQDATFHIFTVNSGGDVISTTLSKRKDMKETSKGDCDVGTDLREFERHCLRINTKRSIKDGEVVDMSHVFRDMKKHPKKETHKKTDRAHWPCEEMYSPESLCYYKDFMAERILHVWGHEMRHYADEEDVRSEMRSADEDDAKSDTSVKNKVEEWMRDWQIET